MADEQEGDGRTGTPLQFAPGAGPTVQTQSIAVNQGSPNFPEGKVAVLHSTSREELNNEFVVCCKFNEATERQSVMFLKPSFENKKISVKLDKLMLPTISRDQAQAANSVVDQALGCLDQYRSGQGNRTVLKNAIQLARQALEVDVAAWRAYRVLGDAYHCDKKLRHSYMYYRRSVANGRCGCSGSVSPANRFS